MPFKHWLRDGCIKQIIPVLLLMVGAGGFIEGRVEGWEDDKDMFDMGLLTLFTSKLCGNPICILILIWIW